MRRVRGLAVLIVVAGGLVSPAFAGPAYASLGPSISTTQQPATATVGSSIADKATVSGGDSPTGTVTFNLYDNSAGTGTPLFTDTETLSGSGSGFTCPPADQAGFSVGVTDYTVDPIFCSYPAVANENPNDFYCTYSSTTGALVTDNDAGFCAATAVGTASSPGTATSGGYTTTATGTFYWVATYNGDGNNNAVSSGTAAEPVSITAASPSISTTQQPASAPVGSSIADKATVSGGYSPTGTVTFNLYNNSAGTGTPLFTNTQTLSGGTATSAGYTTTTTGTVYWVATYNGDSNNIAVSSGTAAEPVSISGAAQHITFPALRNRSIVESPFAIAGVTGGASGNPVTFTASGGKCTVSGTTVNLIHTGTCTITAHQAGNATYTAAPNVSRSFTISTAPSLRIGDANTVEGNSGTHPLTFNVTLSKAVSVPVTVHWTTANSSATAPSDFTAASGTLTFAPGQTTRTISVTIKGDKTKEASEVFFVLLNQPHNATIADPNASGGIINDD